ncbi:NACHT and WD repeat domain-containing protein 2-like [Porites lutea]|uniref:NACHT and WD repeat domain-containing protein 2-like n=1 Tax=Porites lutea TaxID=51062 RepID=UPI003CC5BA85
MGTGASKKPKVENKQLKPARSKLMAAVALAKPGAVPAPGMQKKTTIETLWKEPRHERGKWKELLEKNLVDFEPVPLDKNMVNTLLRGKTLQTKASDIRIIRVFISSTFTDTAQERNLLIADVYPYLKLFGRKYGFEFASSEMRWGIREECQRESQGINYVAFLGDKYGFRPFPSRIEASEFEQLQAQAEKDNDPDVNLLSEWFDLNTNLVPHTYILKPSSQAQHGKWWDIFEKLQMTLRKASRCLKDKERAKWYTVSVTEEEVHRGLLNMNNRDQKTFCYRRKIINLDNNYQDKPAGKFIDKKYSDGTIDSEAQRFLHKLKDEKVPGALNPSNIKNYTVNWGPGITLEQHADYLREFGDHFCDLMVQSMTEAIKGGHVADDVLFEEVKSHAVFCLEKAAQVYGKDDILEKVSSYLTSDSSTPLVIHGPSGSGKTSIMAKAIANAVASSSDAVIIYRFLGTSMDSTAARPLLRSLCIQLRRIYSKDPNGVANDFKTLCEEFIQNLKLATNGQPLFLFLDSLDQMTDEDNGRNLEWLPFELPSRNVKIVVSTLPEEGGCLNKLRLSLPEEGLVEVTKMSANDGKELLESWLKASNRSLTASQMLEVLDAFNECPYPLFLKIAFETSCTWTSFTPVDDITLSRTVRQLIDDMFDRLIRIHGNLLVDHALGYLTVAKFGLTANELEDILSCDDEVLNDVYQWWEPPVRRLPPLLWVRIQTDLGPYLVERGLKGGTPVLSWYHRQFREAAEEVWSYVLSLDFAPNAS